MKAAETLISLEDVSKSFPRHGGQALLRDHAARLFRRRSTAERFQALKHITLTVSPGESLAIVGHNGAGKSTLLAVMAGLAKPDSGAVQIRGRVAALLELALGFQPDLTGRENLRLNASLLGLSRKETERTTESIIDFAGIREFIEEPLRTYSTGMMMRLAFSVAINADPEIILIDEILAVGDTEFQHKCLSRIREFQSRGTSLVCVSHSHELVRDLCERAVWLDHGRLVMIGEINEVLNRMAGTVPSPA